MALTSGLEEIQFSAEASERSNAKALPSCVSRSFASPSMIERKRTASTV